MREQRWLMVSVIWNLWMWRQSLSKAGRLLKNQQVLHPQEDSHLKHTSLQDGPAVKSGGSQWSPKQVRLTNHDPTIAASEYLYLGVSPTKLCEIVLLQGTVLEAIFKNPKGTGLKKSMSANYKGYKAHYQGFPPNTPGLPNKRDKWIREVSIFSYSCWT